MISQEKSKKEAPHRSRNVQMIIRMTPEEKEFILKKAAKSGCSTLNLYALKMLIAGEVKSVDLSHYHELAREVSRIGTNINQIAKFANANNGIYAQEIKDLQCKMEDIWQLLKSNLSEQR
jgi:hypothetical protein